MILITTPHCFGHPPLPPLPAGRRGQGTLAAHSGCPRQQGIYPRRAWAAWRGPSSLGLGGFGRLSEPLQRRCGSIAPLGWDQHPTLALRCPLSALLPGAGFHSCVIQPHSQQQQTPSWAVLTLRFDDSVGCPSLGIGSPRPARLLEILGGHPSPPETRQSAGRR